MIKQQEQFSYIHSSWTSFNGTHFSLGLQGEPWLCTVMCVIFCFPSGLLAPETLRNFSFSSGTKAFLNPKPTCGPLPLAALSPLVDIDLTSLHRVPLKSAVLNLPAFGCVQVVWNVTVWDHLAKHIEDDLLSMLGRLSIFHVNVQHLIHRINSTHTFVLMGYTRMRPCLTGVLL